MATVSRAIELAVRIGNHPGDLARLMSAISAQSINILAYCAYSERDHGIVRLITENAPSAQTALAETGYEFKADLVVLVAAIDRVGAAAALGAQLGAAGINILYSYASSGSGNEFHAVFKTDKDDEALRVFGGM